ncbi:MAG: PAS domain S-box-containing protein [Psychroserpens sp.]|jgi:PAS domain S-box-containing protein
MKHYEKAISKFYSSLELNPIPLLSWDFSLPNFSNFCKYQKDIDILDAIAAKNQWTLQPKFKLELQEKEQIIVVTDATLKIVYATKNIFEMNGYTLNEIIGKRPKMFQGQGTDKNTISSISKAVKNQLPFEARVLNYRKDGSEYWCDIKAQPLFDQKGKVVNFIAYEREVA